MTEKEIHSAIVKYLEYLPNNILFTSTLGGVYLGSANWSQKSILKKHYKKGVPDILIFEPRNNYFGLMLEIKTVKGRPSVHQKEWIKRLNDKGYLAVITYGFSDAIDIIDMYFTKK